MLKAVPWAFGVTVCFGNPFLEPVPAVYGEKGAVKERYGEDSPEEEGWSGNRDVSGRGRS